MSTVREQLAALGIRYERYPAVDGQSPEVAAEWMAYKRQGPQRRTDPRNVTDWRDFYVGDKPHSARVAFYEEQRGRPAIATAGAWGLYRSMRRVIEKALAAKVERLLILEDDVLFHRDTEMLWKKVTAELPKDWQILQLGAMQLHWEDNWIKWHAQHLYRCQGSSLAAHAVALKADAMRAVLARVEAPALPFDVGPLTEVKRLYKDRCFTVYPNIVIQDGRDSEIGMSKIFATEVAKKTNVYRWAYEEYGPAALAAAAAEAAAARKAKRIKRPQAVLSQPETDPLPLQPYGTALDDVDRIVVLLSADDTERVSGYIAMLQAQKE